MKQRPSLAHFERGMMQSQAVAMAQLVQWLIVTTETFSSKSVIGGNISLPPSVWKSKKGALWAATMVPWFCLCLPSCGRGFKSQAHHLSFFSICIIEIVMRKGQKQKKRGRVGPIFKKESQNGVFLLRHCCSKQSGQPFLI